MKKNNIGGIPIISKTKKLCGIVTNRDLRFERDGERSIKEIMTSKNLITVSPNTSLKDAEQILQKHKIEKLPVVDDSYKLVGLITYRDITKQTVKPISNKDIYGRLRLAAAVGVTNDVIERTQALVDASVDAIVIDTSHAHSKRVAEILKDIDDKMLNLLGLEQKELPWLNCNDLPTKWVKIMEDLRLVVAKLKYEQHQDERSIN